LFGDPDANLLKVRDFSGQAENAGAELIVFPEMIDTGYSTPAIEANAASWTDGSVPGLQEITRTNDEGMTKSKGETCA
jgi:predicted amidohydrolase